MANSITYERGVIVDDEGYFLGAVQWEAGTPEPDVNGPRPDGSSGPRLRLLRDPEAIADPVASGKWDTKAKAWLRPSVEMWIVNVRRDQPRYGSLAGGRMVWPSRVPRLPPWQAWVSVPPPQGSRARIPLFDFEAQEWISPVTVAEFDAQGVCTNLVVKPRLDPGDEQPFTVENEIGETEVISPGVPREGGHPPRYRKVPVRVLRRVLQDLKLMQPFQQFIERKGYTIENVEDLGVISLNNRMLREFVAEQGFNMRQTYMALQRVAEDTLDQEQQAKRELADEE